MPALNCVAADKELQRLIQIYLKAETDIINEISRLRSLGLVDYRAQAALDRVQAILRKLESDSWEYVPQLIERQFYVRHPEARKLSARGETPEKHKAGRRWSLHPYASMVLRTTYRHAEVLSVLTQNNDWDLFKFSSHGTTCKLCAPYEGRVYSKSGKDPDFPPLAAAFGKVDPAGPDDLLNTYLNIHPNCLHQLIRWTPMGHSKEEIQKIKDFSSFSESRAPKGTVPLWIPPPFWGAMYPRYQTGAWMPRPQNVKRPALICKGWPFNHYPQVNAGRCISNTQSDSCQIRSPYPLSVLS